MGRGEALSVPLDPPYPANCTHPHIPVGVLATTLPSGIASGPVGLLDPGVQALPHLATWANDQPSPCRLSCGVMLGPADPHMLTDTFPHPALPPQPLSSREAHPYAFQPPFQVLLPGIHLRGWAYGDHHLSSLGWVKGRGGLAAALSPALATPLHRSTHRHMCLLAALLLHLLQLSCSLAEVGLEEFCPTRGLIMSFGFFR